MGRMTVERLQFTGSGIERIFSLNSPRADSGVPLCRLGYALDRCPLFFDCTADSS